MTTLGCMLHTPVKTYVETLKWEILPHRLYSPNTAPSDYYLFRSIAHGQHPNNINTTAMATFYEKQGNNCPPTNIKLI